MSIDVTTQEARKAEFRNGWHYQGVCTDRCGKHVSGSEETQQGDGQAEHLHQHTGAQEDDEIHGPSRRSEESDAQGP